MNEFSIRPVHSSFQTLDTDQTHDNLTSDYNDSNKGYKEFDTLLTNQTHNSLQLSGYQYLLDTTATISKTDGASSTDSLIMNLKSYLSEPVTSGDSIIPKGVTSSVDGAPSTDSLNMVLKIYITEGVSSFDGLFVTNFSIEDTANVYDQVVLAVDSYMSDLANIGDSITLVGKTYLVDGAPSTDSLVMKRLIYSTEYTPVGDSVAVRRFINDNSSMGIFGLKYTNNNSSMMIGNIEYINNNSSMQIGGIQPITTPVTDVQSASNPFAPTIILNGSALVLNSSTAPLNPDAIATTPAWLNLSPAGYIQTVAFPSGYCNAFTYSINLGLGGGSFKVITADQLGVPGSPVTIFGLPANITVGAGQHISNSGAGYVTHGTFGFTNLDRQIQIALAGADFKVPGLNLLPTQYLSQPPSAEWTTLSGGAQAVASAAGIGLTWLAPDAPLTDMFPQTGTTVIGALQSLAAKVGAWVVWTGNNQYVVITPDQPFNGWSAPPCQLLGPGGAEQKQNYNIADPVVIFPVHAVGGGGTITSPTQLDPNAIENINKVQKFGGSITRKLTADDPNRTFDIPGIANQIWIQIKTKTDTSGNSVTTSDDEWFVFANPNTASSRVVTRGYKQKQLVVMPSDFPEGNADIDADNFIMSFGWTANLDDYIRNFNKAQQESSSTGSYVTDQSQENIRYVKVSEGFVNAVFSGSVPLPGMGISGQATAGDVTVNMSGIIESVSITSPGFITVQFATYQKLNFVQPRNHINALNSDGGTAGH